MDRFSPVSPAHVRVLVLPVGRIERATYVDFVRRLQDEAAIVQHRDLRDHIGDEETLLSPKKFEQGCLLFNYTTSSPSEALLGLSPYELFREPLLVVGVVGGLGEGLAEQQKELKAATEYLREKHPRVVHRHLLITQDTDKELLEHVDNAIAVEQPLEAGHPSLQHAVRMLAVRFLRELSTYVQAMQASPSIPTPGQTSKALQKTSWLRDADQRSNAGSGYGTPNELGSPVGEDGPSRPPSRSRGSPATSFDQMPGANTVPSALARSESAAGRGGRASSHDRMPIQGFGTGGSQEKSKKRGKARVGIVVGATYMVAGMWKEALQILVEHTTQARALQDHLWHAKGMENILACLLLHAWAGLDFQLPEVCYGTPEKHGGRSHAQRFSVNLPQDFRPTGAANEASVRRLCGVLPELLRQMLAMFRVTEGPLELPSLVVCEVTIRFSKLLAILLNANGLLDQTALAQVVESKSPDMKTSTNVIMSASVMGPTTLSKGAIADTLITALPTSEDVLATSDHLVILAGIASVYALLGMDRKKAMTLKDLVVRLTTALNQARKLGAAEMGIHPAASLSAENGADALLSSIQESAGMMNMIADLANIYGVRLIGAAESGDEDQSFDYKRFSTSRARAFGGDALKIDTLRDLLSLCEASPDPYGILRLIASFLSFAGSSGTVDIDTADNGVLLGRDEQARLASTISRTIGVSKQLGLSDTQATYWDPFLVRAVEFLPPSISRNLLERSQLKTGSSVPLAQTPGNPLLYDPNASRRATAQQSTTLVQDEAVECYVTLQNPFDVAFDIESLHLVTEGVDLQTKYAPIQLGPARLQQVSITVTPAASSKVEIKGCRVKIAGCAEQTFSIVSRPFSASRLLCVKSIGQEARGEEEDPKLKSNAPEYASLAVEVMPPIPVLVSKGTTLVESSLMLLEGEKKSFDLTVSNTSGVEAAIMGVVSSAEGLRLVDADQMSVRPNDTKSITLEVTGRAGVSDLRADIFYGSLSDSDRYARMLSVPISITVNAALQAHHLDITPSSNPELLDVAFDIGNAWPKAVSFDCRVREIEVWQSQVQGSLAPGEVQRLHSRIRRWTTYIPSEVTSEQIKEALLARLRVIWKVEGRTGEVALQALTLPAEAISVLRGDAISIKLDLEETSLVPGCFTTLRTSLHNHTGTKTGPLLVQVHAKLPGPADERRVAVAGSLSRLVPPVAAGETAMVEFALCPLLAGKLSLVASAGPALKSREIGDVGGGRSRSLVVFVG